MSQTNSYAKSHLAEVLNITMGTFLPCITGAIGILVGFMQNGMLSTGENLDRKQGGRPWATSAAIHVVAVAALLSIHGIADSPFAYRHTEIVTPLAYLPPVQEHRTVPPRVVRTPAIVAPIQHPRALIVKRLPPVISSPPRPAAVTAPTAPEPVLQAALPALTPVRVKTPDLPSRPAPPPAPVKMGIFGSVGESPNGRVPSPRLEVQTGAFGGAEGNSGQAQSGKAVASGSGVHTGAFGAVTGTATGSVSGIGKAAPVADAGFGNAVAQAAAPHRAEAATPAVTPVEVLWKPKPVYTSEARAKKLEGNVTLEVVFRATGDVQVVRVVRGLGYGLDESARAAAEQIRFRPGKKDGVPVDRTGLVLITFELT